MKFITDRMLGRLARWLRLFGYDTLEIRKQENEDELLLELAEKEGKKEDAERVYTRAAALEGAPAGFRNHMRVKLDALKNGP